MTQQNVQLVPMFDPYTGQPLQPRFDPYTGLPLAGVSTVQAEDALVVHPTANGGQHDASWTALADRITALEERMDGYDTITDAIEPDTGDVSTEVPTISGNPQAMPSRPNLDKIAASGSYGQPSTGTDDTASIAATGGVTGTTDPAPGLLDSGSVPTNQDGAYPTADPTGAPALADERGEKPITSGPAFVPADESTGPVS